MLKGSLVALVTPFDQSNRVDFVSLKRLIDFHVAEGSNGLVIAGTTGESATLETREHIELVTRAVEFAAGRLPILAGTGSNSTAQTIDLSVAVRDTGIDGYLVVVPSLLGNCGCCRKADHAVQRAGANCCGPAAGNGGEAGAARQYFRNQGSNG